MNNSIGQLHSEDSGGVFKGGMGNNISALCSFSDHLGTQVVEADSAQLTRFQVVGQKFVNRSLDSGSGHVSFKTTALTAIAKSSCRIYRSVTEFTCNAMMAIEQNASAYKTASQACP